MICIMRAYFFDDRNSQNKKTKNIKKRARQIYLN